MSDDRGKVIHSGVDDPEHCAGEEKDRARSKKPVRRPRISLRNPRVMDEAEQSEGNQNHGHDVEDRCDTDAAERRVEASHSLFDRHRDLLQGGQK